MYQQLDFNAALIRKYDTSGPRYTSYPTAQQFTESFTTEDYIHAARTSNEDAIPRPLSVYFHIPFCSTVCYYCACNKVVTKDRSRAEPYLARLHREIELQSELFDRDRDLLQLHIGGGTPTFISHAQMSGLINKLGQHFSLVSDSDAEYSIEIDPREASSETIAHLRQLGFNRLSLGVQDLDERVQKAVNRVQPWQQTQRVIEDARKNDYHSLSLDLIYGLPFQTVHSFDVTLQNVIDWRPNRISVFNYAHMPHLFKPQRRIDEKDLPSPAEKLVILHHTIERLLDAGYVYIGMDHFALPDDELAVAQRQGTLSRNFQGYATHSDCDLIAMGITAISKVCNTYSQNVKQIDQYHQSLDNGVLPIFRGYRLTVDDQCRRQVIEDLMCQSRVVYDDYQFGFGINFKDYFQRELQATQAMQDDGLVRLADNALEVLPAGRLLLRNICMVFDSHLTPNVEGRFSRVI